MLVGRDREGRLLTACLASAASGTSSIAVVCGPPGIGKSSLLEDVRRAAAGWPVLDLTGSEAETCLAYAGLHALLRPALGGLGNLPAVYNESLRRALGLLDGEPPTPFHVAGATLELLAQYGSPRLLVLVDDLHWVDEQSTSALLFALRRLRSEPIAAVLGVRRGTVAARLVADVPTVLLGELDAADARACVRSTFPELDDDVCLDLVRRIGGNPLALIEAARDLLSERRDTARTRETGRGVRGGSEPFEWRVGRASEGVRTAILVTALEPLMTRSALVGVLTDLHVPPGVLDEAATSGLLRLGPDEVRLAHPLVGEAVLRQSSPGHRRAAHMALAGPVPTGMPSSERWRSVWHEGAGSARPDERLARGLDEIAQVAEARGDLAAAARGHRRAADLSETPERRAERLFRAGAGAITAGLPWGPVVLEEVRHATDDGAIRGAVDRLLVVHATWNGNTNAALKIADRSDTRPDPATQAFTHAAATSAAFVAWGGPRFAYHTERARTASIGLPAEQRYLADVVVAHHDAFVRGPSPIAVARDVAQRFALAPDPDLATPLVQLLMTCDEWRLADDVMRRALRDARAAAAVPAIAWLQCWTSAGMLRSGDLVAAEAAGEEASSLAHTIGLTVAHVQAEAMLAQVDATAGRPERCRQRILSARAVARERGFLACDVWLLFAEAFLASSEGDALLAVQLFSELTARLHALGSEWDLLIPGTPELVVVLARTGRLRQAHEHLAHLEETVAEDPLPTMRAWLAHGRLAVAPDASLDGLYEEAATTVDAVAYPLLSARTDLLYGERVRRAGRRPASAVLGAAVDRFDAIGAAGWARRARQELAAIGGPVSRTPPKQHGVLTPQEHQIAVLAATGAPTREIATSIFLSPKTVEYHLTHVYRKLGVRSKAELAHAFLAAAQAR
jgi:DNA-binding CsgD family transcriptional regulator